MSIFDVTVVGSLNMDLVARTPRLPAPGETVLGTAFVTVPGGKGLNQAVAAARQGARTAMIGAVGGDAMGESLLALLEAEAIDAVGVQRLVGSPTGVALIAVSDAGENLIVVVPEANGRVDDAAIARHASTIAGSCVVLAQLECPLVVVAASLAVARGAGAVTILNPAPAPADGLPDAILALCDILVPNEHEAALLTGLDTSTVDGAIAAARVLLRRGVGAVVVTMGERGAVLVDGPTAAGLLVTAFRVTPLDSTAAGDAFCGALAAALATGSALPAALERASAAGALATTVAGATPSLPTLAATEALQRANPTHTGAPAR